MNRFFLFRSEVLICSLKWKGRQGDSFVTNKTAYAVTDAGDKVVILTTFPFHWKENTAMLPLGETLFPTRFNDAYLYPGGSRWNYYTTILVPSHPCQKGFEDRDVITCPCPWYLLLVQHPWYKNSATSTSLLSGKPFKQVPKTGRFYSRIIERAFLYQIWSFGENCV